ncbi:MAG: hypothetical protein ACQGVC_21650, partial [Myxococcota bacterium]
LGLGSRREVDEQRRREITRVAVERALALGVGGSVAMPLPPAGDPDPGVELRLEEVARAMTECQASAERDGRGPLAVHLRLVPTPQEHAPLVEALRSRARSRGRGALRFELPPEAELAAHRKPAGSPGASTSTLEGPRPTVK